MGYYTNYYKLALVEKHLMLYSPCIETVDVQSKIGNCRTAFFQQGRGVRQGCSLSPTLFNIYINELAEALDRSGSIPGIALHDSEVKCLLYADDPGSDVPHSRGPPAQPGPAATVLWGMGSDGQPGQNQSHGVPEEGQVSGKQITSSVTEEKFWSTAPATLTWAFQISASGGFSLAVKALYEKARRAFLCHQITVWPIKTTN